MEIQTDLTSIFLELTQLNARLTPKEESIYISSLIYLLQTPERFTHTSIPNNVLKLLEHRYTLCTPGIKETLGRSVFDNESLHSLDPILHPGLLFLQFSPNSLISDWLSVTFLYKENVIQVSNLHLFRYTLEIIFTHIHASKHLNNSSIQESVISEFLSSQYQNSDQQSSQFFHSLSRIFKLFSRDALILLLNSNRNGEVLLDYLIAALVTEHSETYSSIIRCLITLLNKLHFHIWKYINDDLSLITNLIVSPCLFKTLEEWNSSHLNELIFHWCIPYFSSLQTENNALKHSKILFKWLSYLSNYSSSHPEHRYTQYTFLDIILETLPMPDFVSDSLLACAVSRLFSSILIIAFEEKPLDLLISTKEDWLPLFLAIRTAFFKEQSPSVQSQLSFKYFRKDNRFNLTSSQQDSPALEVFRLCHDFIVKVFNSGLERSAPSAESIVTLCKQRQPINKVGTKIVCLLKELKTFYELEESKPSVIIDLVDNDSDNSDENIPAEPDIEEVYSTDRMEEEKFPDLVSGNLSSPSSPGQRERDLDMDIFEDYDSHMSKVRAASSSNIDPTEISFSDEEISSTTSGPANSTQLPHGNSFSPKEFKNMPNFPSVKISVIKNGALSAKKIFSKDFTTSKSNINQDTHKSEPTIYRKRKISEVESEYSKPLIIKIDLNSVKLKSILEKPIAKTSIIEPKTKTAICKIDRISESTFSSNKIQRVSPTSTSHVFDISYDVPATSYDSLSSEDKIEADCTIRKSIGSEDSQMCNITPCPSTQDYDQVRQDLYLSQQSIDDNEDSPIVLRKNEVAKPKYILKSPKRRKTTVTTMRPPFSRSRLGTFTDSTPDTDSQKAYKDSLYKNSNFKVPTQSSSRTSPPNEYLAANISINLPDIDKEISPGKIKRMNEAAKHDIQPKINPIVHGSPQAMRKKISFTNPSPKRVYTQHAQGTTIITNPTSKINPEEIIDKILTWSPDYFLKEGCKPPMPSLSPLTLSYTSYDNYKHMFTNFLLHEVWSNLEEEFGKTDRTWEYVILGLYPYTQQCTMDNQRFNLAKLEFYTNHDNEMDVVEFIKEQDIVLMKAHCREPDPKTDVLLFGYITRVQVSKIVPPESANQQNPRPSRVLISLKYNTCHLSTPFLKASIKPVMSLTTYSRQWQGLINLYKNIICQYILSPNLRVCDPPRPSALSKVRIPNESPFNESQKLAIAKITSMVSEPYVCPRIALLLGPPGCGKSHTITGCVQAILHAVSSDRPKQHILLCAPSNAAADELAIKMLERGLIDIKVSSRIPSTRDGNHNGGRLSLIRLGLLEQVHQLIKSFHIDNLVGSAKVEDSYKIRTQLKEEEKRQCQLQGQLKQLDVGLNGLKMQHQLLNDKRLVTQDIRESEATKREKQTKLANSNREIDRLQDILRKNKAPSDSRIRESLLSNVNIILTTLSSSGISMMEDLFKKRDKPMHFSCVIVDEATQCSELDVLIPLQFMITKLVLVGDPNQLPAVVRSSFLRKQGFEMSLFERFKLFFKDTCTNEPIILLDTQYRMHPEICHFPNCTFYENKLQTAKEVVSRASTKLDPYLLFHLSYGKELTNKPGQIVNAKEIEFVASLVRELLTKHPPSSIGIITPYLAQQRELIKIIHVYSNKIDIKSVDGFQGKEKDIIIISCVRSKSRNGTIGFLSNPKRINVAITRAKKALYIVGDVDSLKRNETWCKLIEDADRRDRLITIEALRAEECLRRIWLSENERI